MKDKAAHIRITESSYRISQHEHRIFDLETRNTKLEKIIRLMLDHQNLKVEEVEPGVRLKELEDADRQQKGKLTIVIPEPQDISRVSTCG